MAALNKQVLLASRPQGAVTEDNFRIVEAPVGKPGPGEVLVSQTVKDLVSGSGLAFDDRGVHTLKGVPGEWRVYAAL